jgi:lipopolysaccharide/colanic/teichoic acid biosynthesis glycosyltransferase
MGALVGLSLLIPFGLIVAAAIKLDDGGPVFYTQDRVGYRGRVFRIFKFRTMRVRRLEGPHLTVGGDTRVTRVGRWLRKAKLDELPQLINVLLGDMSLVGPRPEVPALMAQYSVTERRVLDYVPGMTDPASIEYRNEGDRLVGASDPERAYLAEVVPAKIAMSVQYAQRATLRSDLAVIMRTLRGTRR